MNRREEREIRSGSAILAQLIGETIVAAESVGYENYSALVPTHSATIGMHLRHIGDHVRALIQGLTTGTIEYDARQAGGPEERDCALGLAYLGGLAASLCETTARDDDRVRVRVYMDPTRPPREYFSTVGREVAFILNHTVHHNAVIKLIAAQLNCVLPQYFGFAPSTVARLLCAQ